MQIIVQTLAGRDMELELDPSSTVYDLKTKVKDTWQIDHCYQGIVVGSHKFVEVQSLAEVAAFSRCVHGSMNVTVISYEDRVEDQSRELRELISNIEYNRDGPTRFYAVRKLIDAVEGDDEREFVLTEILKQMSKNTSKRVTKYGKRGFLEVVSQIASRGHDDSIDMACRMLQDDDENVRLTAADTVKNLATRGHEIALGQVLSIIKYNPRISAKAAAISTLGRLAPKECDDKKAHSEIMQLLGMQMENKDALMSAAANAAVQELF